MSHTKRLNLLIPAVSLSAILIASSLPSKSNQFINTFLTTTCNNSYTSFMEDDLPDLFEENLKNTFDNSMMVPQGLSISDDYIFISMYDYTHTNNSIIQVYDKEGNLVNNCQLYNKAHVGGISYDKERDLLWVSSYLGNVDAYSVKDIVNKESSSPRYKDLYLGQNLRCYNRPFETAVSYLAINDNTLFVGNYTITGKGTVKQFKIDMDKDRTIHLKEIHRFRVPTSVQGISFYEKDNNTYMLLSRSRGIHNPSLLQIFKYNEEIDDYTKSLVNSKSFSLPPLVEQITTEDEAMYSLYESQSTPYRKDNNTEKTLIKSNLNILLSSIN